MSFEQMLNVLRISFAGRTKFKYLLVGDISITECLPALSSLVLSLSISLLTWKLPLHDKIFLVSISICSNSSFVHCIIPNLGVKTGMAKVLWAITLLFEYNSDDQILQICFMSGLSMNILHAGYKLPMHRGFSKNGVGNLLPALRFLGRQYHFCNFVIGCSTLVRQHPVKSLLFSLM